MGQLYGQGLLQVRCISPLKSDKRTNPVLTFKQMACHCPHICNYLHSAMHMLRRRVGVLLLSMLHLLLQWQWRKRTQARQERPSSPVPHALWCASSAESLCPEPVCSSTRRCAARSAHRHPPNQPAIPLQCHADIHSARRRPARKTPICHV
jgi:hypothetical protein